MALSGDKDYRRQQSQGKKESENRRAGPDLIVFIKTDHLLLPFPQTF